MATVKPPPPRPASLGDDGPLRRVHFRLWQIALSALTILITAWCFTISMLAGFLAVLVAKHVLVAILAAGLRLPPNGKKASEPRP